MTQSFFLESIVFNRFIKFALICLSCILSLFAGVSEDQDKILKISDSKACVDTLRIIMREKMQVANSANLAYAKHPIDLFFASGAFWEANPKDLTSVSWSLYPQFARAYSLLSHSEIGKDSHFTKYGYKVGTIEAGLNSKLINAFLDAKTIPFLLEDSDANYLSSSLDINVQEGLNKNLRYFMCEDLQKEALGLVLQSLKKEISDCVGSCWRVLTIRGWKTPPMKELWGTTAWHTDGMPSEVYKILYYPLGVDEERGSTLLRFPQGEEIIKGPPGTWLLFKNSEITHRAFAPKRGERVMLEITLTPSMEYDLRPISAGLNARHPLLPWLELASSKHPIYQREEITGLNIGGGSHWCCPGWVNLEEVPSPSNPTPFHLYPNCRFPFTDQSIKNVYASHILEYLNLPTVYRVLSESYRVLEIGGNFIIKMPDYDKALDSWQRQDYSFFGSGWDIENMAPTWQSRGIYDCLDYRATTVFCSFFNDIHGNPFSGVSNSQGYFGPPIADVNFLRDLIKDHTPSQIAKLLRLEVARKELNYHFCRQSAWSRAELQVMLNEFGFEVVSFDPNIVSDVVRDIPGIRKMMNISTYCLAKKRPVNPSVENEIH